MSPTHRASVGAAMKRRIVLDTDMGSDVDDALCLALALASPDLDLVAVTHVTGDTRLRARISRRLLDLAGRHDVPVFAGESIPLNGGPGRFGWFGNEGLGILDGKIEPSIEEEGAVDALIRLFEMERSDDLELVAVGPMTNIATALQRRPSLAARISHLTTMGGHLREISYGGTVYATGIDYNLCSDPEASMIVLSSGIPTRLVTGDVTLQTWLTQSGLERIKAAGGTLRATLAAAVDAWTPIMNDLFGRPVTAPADANVAFLHDPLALTAVFDESYCTFEVLPIEPAIEAGVFRTIERRESTPRTHEMRCAVAVDAPRFREFFIDRLMRLPSTQ